MLIRCARCGIPNNKKEMLHSKHTGSYYCFDPRECARRESNDLTLEEFHLLASHVTKEIQKL